MKSFIYITLLIVLLKLNSTAQDSSRINTYTSSFYLFDKQTKNSFLEIDTLLNHVPNYNARTRIGSIGVPDYGLLLTNKEYELGAHWFKSGYDKEIMALQNDAYFSNKKIATSIYGAAGTQKEQALKLAHVQNINEHLNFTLKLNRITSTNFYQYQQSFVNNLLFSSHFLNPKNRIGYVAKFSFDRYKHQENGGILSDSVFINERVGNKLLVPVHLKSAKRNFRIMSGEAKLFYHLTKDSLSHKGHYLSLGAGGSITKTEYNDAANSNYYPTIYKDSLITHDSIRFSKFTPNVAYNYLGQRMAASIGGKYDVSRLSYSRDTSIVCASIIADQTFAWMNTDSNFVMKQQLNYVASGTNSGDYKGMVTISYKLNFLKSILALTIQTENRSPDLFYKYYSSNNYYWKNDFNKNKSNLVDASISIHKLGLQLGTCINNQSNMIYLGSNDAPTQVNSSVTAMRFYFNHTLKIARFYLVNKLNYQTTNSYAWALPSLFTQHQLFYEHHVKKNGMLLQVGVQADYIGAMDLIKYNPALNSFVIDYAIKKGGDYVFADVFFTLRYKYASFFFKVEHANQGYTGYNYSLLQNYYQRDRAFRFGLNWNFRD